MTHHPIAQIASNGNLKSQEKRRLAAVFRRIDYFTRRVSPGASTVPQFFTDDYVPDVCEPVFDRGAGHRQDDEISLHRLSRFSDQCSRRFRPLHFIVDNRHEWDLAEAVLVISQCFAFTPDPEFDSNRDGSRIGAAPPKKVSVVRIFETTGWAN